MSSDSVDDRKNNEGYKLVKKVFPQVKSAGSAVKKYIGGISRPNRISLQLAKNSSKLRDCPCPGATCTFAFQCRSFKDLHLAQKVSFVKKEGLCCNCLISHQGSCNFFNRHKCKVISKVSLTMRQLQ